MSSAADELEKARFRAYAVDGNPDEGDAVPYETARAIVTGLEQQNAALVAERDALREAIGKAITIIEPYCSDGDDQTMLEAALEWLRRVSPEPASSGDAND
jgi:hypothetical protein